MMMVHNVKGQMVEVGPGVSGSVSEATVTLADGKDVFVYGTCFEECYDFGVTEKSLYEMIVNNESIDDEAFMERYGELDNAKKSAYSKVFSTLDKMLRLIEG